MSEVKTPWKDYMGDVPMHLEYFQGTMFEAVENIAHAYPNNIAFTFMGRSTTYRRMVQEVERCAKSLKVLGIRPGDKVTIAMPNCPQAIFMFYAVNLVGGIANMIHPLSAEKEIEFYLNASESVTAITLDQFYNKFEHIRQNTKIGNIIIASVKDELSRPIRAGYMLTEGRKIQKIPEDAPVIRWREFMDMARYCFYKNYRVERRAGDPAVILYSGGTTGTTKGICLSSYNFNALALQTIAASGYKSIRGCTMLSVMPVFHGFGLGIGIHTALVGGACCILVPNFNIRTYADLLRKKHPNFIPGVPTLFEALLRTTGLEKLDMSFLMGVFSGGDSLSVELKHKVDAFLRAHNVVPGMIDGKRVEKNARMMKTAMTMLARFRKVLAALTINPARALEELNSDWTASQEIADRLMRDHGLPFRIGHHMASRMVGWARANNVLPLEFPYAQMRRIYREEVSEEYPEGPAELPMSEEEFRAALDPRSIVAARRTAGSASPAEVRKMLEADAGRLAALRAEREAEEARVAKALEDLDEAFRKLL